METPARPTSLALAESQNIQPKGQVGGSGVQSAKSAMSDKASSGSSFGSSSAAAAGGGSTPAAAITGAVGSSVEGKPSKAGRQAVGGGMGAAPPATPAVAPASRATADTGASAAGAAAAASFATPAAALTFATPAAPARPAGAGAAGEGAGAEGEGGGGGGGGGGAEVATDRMILATPTSASTPATAEPARASSPAPAAPPADAAAAAAAGPTNSSSAPVDDEAESLALARQLLEEEAMASYAAAVDIFRSSAAAAAAGGVGIEGVAAEDMAAMQALMEEDENNPGAFAMAEDESLDYDGMLELGSAIGDVKKDRWRMRCKAVIAALPRFTYAAGGSAGVEDTKCLVCQCDYEEGDELRRLPCSHVFHTGCVDGWLEQNEECPTCRQSVSPSSQA